MNLNPNTLAFIGASMSCLYLFPLAGSAFCAAIVLIGIAKRRWNPVALAFYAGMGALVLMQSGGLLSLRASAEEDALFWVRSRLIGEALFAANCLLFSIIFAKNDIKAAIKKWRLALGLSFVLPALLLIFMAVINEDFTISGASKIDAGYIARGFNVSMLIVSIIILMNFEYTFRSSSGLERWQIKYVIFGMGAIVSLYIYVLSQRILYNIIDMTDIYTISIAVIAANCLITLAIVRNKIVDGEIYVSRKVIYSSFSLIAIGIYTIIVALSARFLKSLNIHKNLKVDILLAFLAILMLLVVFYKESFRRRVKTLINKNFAKQKYVYHDEWMVFSTELSKKINTKDICESFLKTLSERIYVKYTSIWLFDEVRSKLHMADCRNMEKLTIGVSLENRAMGYLYEKKGPVPASEIMSKSALLQPLGKEVVEMLSETKAALLVPLILGDKWVGLLTMGKILTGETYDETQDYGLLKSAAAHAASAISNARLFEESMRLNEEAAFHRLSAFLMHDLKNATSMLSMVAQNAEKHINNSDFQRDALKTIAAAVGRMKKMIGSLSEFPMRLEIHLEDIDLNALIGDTLSKLSLGWQGVEIKWQAGRLPRIRADAEEIAKVLQNLLLNAHEALGGKGIITVWSLVNGDHVAFNVSDNGPGMLPDFMENSLFQPFKSTKRKGLGIGLYQCKEIVEAHGGRIEVASGPGEGATFSIFLPVIRS